MCDSRVSHCKELRDGHASMLLVQVQCMAWHVWRQQHEASAIRVAVDTSQQWDASCSTHWSQDAADSLQYLDLTALGGANAHKLREVLQGRQSGSEQQGDLTRGRQKTICSPPTRHSCAMERCGLQNPVNKSCLSARGWVLA